MKKIIAQPETNVKIRGFTLIELMMVLAIMLLLAAMITVAVKNVLTGSRASATRATIRKIDGLLTSRLNAAEREFTRGSQYNTGDGQAIAFRKEQFIRLFPQTFEEAQRRGMPKPGTGHNPATESAAVLYWMLVENVLDASDIGSDGFTSSEVMDTDGDGLMEFVDSWGEPLRFYRWPTRLVRPAFNGAQTQALNSTGDGYAIPVDPDWSVLEPYGIEGATAAVLLGNLPTAPNRGPTFAHESTDPLAQDADDPLGLTNPTDPEFSRYFGTVRDFETRFHTPQTYSVPLIVSAGPDREFGLFAPNDKAMHGHLCQPQHELTAHVLDNITNRN